MLSDAKRDAAQQVREGRMELEKQRGATTLEREQMRQEGLAASDKAYAQQKNDASLANTKTRFLQALAKVGVPPESMAAVEAAQDPDTLNRAYTEATQKTLVPILMPDGSTPYVPAARAQRMLNEQASLDLQRQRQEATKSEPQKTMEEYLRGLRQRLSSAHVTPGEASFQPLLREEWSASVAYANLQDAQGQPQVFKGVPRRTMTGAQLAQNLQAADPAHRAGILRDVMDAMRRPVNGYVITGLAAQEVLTLAQTYGVKL